MTNDATDNVVNPSSTAQGGSDIVQPGDPAAGGTTPRTFPRQVLTGTQRGTQTITGSTIINDPTSGNEVINTSGPNQNITFSDPTTQTPRVVEGLLPDGSYGLWVSQPGIDVTNATLDQLIFNSNQNIFKIVDDDSLTLTFTATSNNSSALVQKPHGLGYIPKLFAQVIIDENLTPFNGFTPNTLLPFTAYNAGLVPVATFYASVDNLNVYFSVVWATGLGSGTFTNTMYYSLLQESFTS